MNDKLTTLQIVGNKIGDHISKVIGEALAANAPLQVLALDENIIGDDGAIAIGNALKTNRECHS